MRDLKRTAAGAFAMLLAASVTVMPAAAASLDGDAGITAQAASSNVDLSTHTFKAYQIFKGTQTEDGNSLYSVGWGTGVNASNLFNAILASDALKADFTGITYDADHPDVSADAVARVVAGWTADGEKARAFARLADANKTGSGVEPGENMDAGYYLVVDTTTVDGQEGEARNLSILQMTKAHPFTPENKTDVPTLEKKVGEKNDSVAGDLKEAKVADYDLGDEVPFTLTYTPASNIGNYSAYHWEVQDTLSAGLTLKTGSVEMKQGGTALTIPDGALTEKTDGFNIVIDNLFTDIARIDRTQPIIVTYKAVVTDIEGLYKTENTAHLVYSNDPNVTGTGTTGHTPDDKAYVYSYTFEVNKTDDEGAALSGATFRLYKKNAETGFYDAVGEAQSGGPKFTFKGLDAGLYKIEEVSAPSGYNKIQDLYFEITSNAGEAATTPENLAVSVSDVKDAENGNVIMNADGTTKTFTITAKAGTDGTFETSIANAGGILLPSTGGTGSVALAIGGSIVLLGAAGAVVTKKKRG